jgi:hypothetical protein
VKILCLCSCIHACKDISFPLLLVLLITCQNFFHASQHVPRINGEIPSIDEATSDHERLLNRYCVQILLLQIKQNSFPILSDWELVQLMCSIDM